MVKYYFMFRICYKSIWSIDALRCVCLCFGIWVGEGGREFGGVETILLIIFQLCLPETWVIFEF